MTTRLLSHYIRTDGPGTALDYLGERFCVLADATDTGGAFGVMAVSAHQGHEPPPHRHTREDEAFYLLAGEWTFTCGETTTDAGPGSLVFLPRGLMHTFRMRTPTGRGLVIYSPAGLEEGFRDLSVPLGDVGPDGLPPVPQGPPPVARMLEVFGGLGVELVAP